MNNKKLIGAAVSLIVILLGVIFYPPAEDTQLIDRWNGVVSEVDKKIPSGLDMAMASEQSPVKDVLKEVNEAANDGRIDDSEKKTILDKNKQAFEDTKKKLRLLIEPLVPEDGDSDEFLAWKEKKTQCLTVLLSTLDKYEEVTEENQQEILEVKAEAEACGKEADELKENISDDGERQKADDSDALEKIALGALAVIAGVIALLYFDLVGGWSLIAGGVAMIACALDSDGVCEDSGDKTTEGHISSKVDEDGKDNLPENLKNDGFEPIGGDPEGEYFFAISAEAQSWLVYKLSEKKEVERVLFKNMATPKKMADNLGKFNSCSVEIILDEATKINNILLKREESRQECPNVSIERVNNKWAVADLDDVSTQ